MAKPEPPHLKVLEHCRVSLPPTFIPPPSPPLTFFDLQWLILHPVQRLFFYSYNQNLNYFMTTDLLNIKHSLSLTLQHFYPLSGTLTWPTQSTKPEILCEDNPGVVLTVAETNLDFCNLVSNHPRGVNEFHPLVPCIPSPNTQVEAQIPVIALQVTVFPDTGICIGISSLHVVADGMTIIHFMKSWATICRSGLSDTSCLVPESLPYYSRNLIHDIDLNNLETIYLNHLEKANISHKFFYVEKTFTVDMDKVRATFILGQPDIQTLKRWLIDQFNEKKDFISQPKHLSSFVTAMAYVWVCLVKVLDDNGMEIEDLAFNVDCRERLNPPLPSTYFGNCLMACLIGVKRKDLVGEDGILFAAKAIGDAIQKMTSEGVLVEAENWFPKFEVLGSKQRFLTLAGSPKLGVYDTDFGWGKPNKVEVISIDTTSGAMALSESRDGEGGIEFGLVLNKLQMDAFASHFTNTLNVLA